MNKHESLSLSRKLARFIRNASFEQLSTTAIENLKLRILDSIGCAIGAMSSPLMTTLRNHLHEFQEAGPCSLIGGGRASPEKAAFYNGSLVRYLDFNDSFLAKEETCHPSDNLSSTLAATDYAHGSGAQLLEALAIAYQIQCRLSEVAPVRKRGFDHTTQGLFAVAGGVAKALGLTEEETQNALGMAGTAFHALRVTRTGDLSHWKGLAYPNMAFGVTHAAFLAKNGVTAPSEVFEGKKGFMESISGPFYIDWENEDLEIVNRTIIKKYNAEIHSQSAIEGALELRRDPIFRINQIERIEVEIFDVAYHIIGGGLEGRKDKIQTKEQADHSLPYLISAALIDGEITPKQYTAARIQSQDVQSLLKKVHVTSSEKYSLRFPHEMPSSITLFFKTGERLSVEKRDYTGFHTRPASWSSIIRKFNQLAEPYTDSSLRAGLIGAVKNLENIETSDLVYLLQRVNQGHLREERHGRKIKPSKSKL